MALPAIPESRLPGRIREPQIGREDHLSLRKVYHCRRPHTQWRVFRTQHVPFHTHG